MKELFARKNLMMDFQGDRGAAGLPWVAGGGGDAARGATKLPLRRGSSMQIRRIAQSMTNRRNF